MIGGVDLESDPNSSVMPAIRELPIGVFDSGVGGLTVLAALRRRLPEESWLYLGDTARLPYGSKSPQTVVRYARQAARVLVERGVKMLVIACNTASAVAIEELRRAFAPLAVIGVVQPGAKAACDATKEGSILVIGTESTIRGGAYERAIWHFLPGKVVFGQACPLFVALAEEGWLDGPIVQSIAHRYLDSWFNDRCHPPVDCLVLGCTHFPVLRSTLSEILDRRVTIVDSTATTAEFVASELEIRGLGTASVPGSAASRIQMLATDANHRFARVGSIFLESALAVEDIELVDLPSAQD